MKIINKNKQKQILQIYRKRIILVKQYCKSNANLKPKQKRKLIYFLDRAIEYCHTMKLINYEKTEYKKDKQLVISNVEQYKAYNRMYQMLKNILNEIELDETLIQENKIKLKKCISYAVLHIKGKMNCSKSW